MPLLFLDEELLLPDRTLLPRLEERDDPRYELPLERDEERLPVYFLLPELLRLLVALVPLRLFVPDRREDTLLRLFVPDLRDDTLLLLFVPELRDDTLLLLFVPDRREDTLLLFLVDDDCEETLLLLLVVADFGCVRETLLFLVADAFVRVVEDPR